ncbi:hypothetical protein HMN09_00410700 [Mycena chlorophos]|uniref:Uncharacterized protein n=2 Tax=Mycena chlorophos TaxID=658473 RepID=A0ABQ0MBF6_MYCCL|nr:hypothetical protein HMN09_00410700 [Mycena chlorophos]GAT60690.1 predicted protein [Mycena chlorophos]
MLATLLSLALVAAPALASLSISSPEFFECGSAHITWDETKAPYNLVVVNSTDPCGEILADLGDHNVTSIHWTVDFPAGSTLLLSLEDADENEAWSSTITVGKGNTTSCLLADASSAAASATEKASTDADPTLQAAGSAVTDDSSDNATVAGALGAASGAAPVALMNPVMALTAVFAAALML